MAQTREASEQLLDRPSTGALVHVRDLVVESRPNEYRRTIEHLAEERVDADRALSDGLDVGGSEVGEVVGDDHSSASNDGGGEHVAILRVVGHLVFDRIDGRLIDRSIRKRADHRGGQALPLRSRDGVDAQESPSSLFQNPLAPARLEAAVGGDPQYEGAGGFLDQHRRVKNTSGTAAAPDYRQPLEDSSTTAAIARMPAVRRSRRARNASSSATRMRR